MDFAPMVEVLRQFGPTGLTIIMMGGGLVYLTKWLRHMAEKNDERYERMQEKFLTSLDTLRKENHLAMSQVVEEFKNMHENLRDDLGGKMDKLAERVNDLRKVA